MKNKIKKAAIMFFIICFAINLTPITAAPNLIFTAINDVFVRSVSPTNIPVRIDGSMYVPVNFFAGSPGLKNIYNAQYNQLVVFNSSHIMTFDITNSVVYNEQGTVYSGNAVKMNGTYYVPAKSVCDCFGFGYSYISKGLLGPILRINSDDNTVSDDVLVEKGFSAMRDIYKEYNSTYGTAQVPPVITNPTEPQNPGAETTKPNVQETQKVVYLAFEGAMGDATGLILNTLSSRNYTATFFAAVGSGPEYLLRAAACGHTIGNNLGGSGSLGAQAVQSSDMIKAVTKTKPRVMMLPGGSDSLSQATIDEMIGEGYRLWDSSTDFKTSSGSASAIYSATTRYLSRTTKNVVLCLKNDEASAAALESLTTYFAAHNYEIRPITETNTPINAILDMR